MSEKVRVVLSIEKEVWEEFKENVKDYPKGIASWVVQRTFEDINLKYDAMGKDDYLEAFFSRKK